MATGSAYQPGWPGCSGPGSMRRRWLALAAWARPARLRPLVLPYLKPGRAGRAVAPRLLARRVVRPRAGPRGGRHLARASGQRHRAGEPGCLAALGETGQFGPGEIQVAGGSARATLVSVPTWPMRPAGPCYPPDPSLTDSSAIGAADRRRGRRGRSGDCRPSADRGTGRACPRPRPLRLVGVAGAAARGRGRGPDRQPMALRDIGMKWLNIGAGDWESAGDNFNQLVKAGLRTVR